MSFFASSLWAKGKQHFRHQTRLSTYGRSIHAHAISNDSQALACGGTEGVKLWDIKSRKNLHARLIIMSPVVRSAALSGSQQDRVWQQPFVMELGWVILYFYIRSHIDMQYQEACARRLGSGFEITCMVWDSTSSEANTRIAVGTRDKIVQVLVLNPNSQLQAVFSVRLDNTMPKSVAFSDNGCVYVFGLYDGNFIKLRADDGAVIKEYSCQSVIGHAAVNQKRGVFVVDNATDGDEEPVRTFVTAVPSVSVPKQVAFGAEGRLVIRGSDHGSVYAFERKSGKVFETLCHSNTGLVQTIATHDVDGRCIVASASPVLGRGKATINLWSYDYGTVKGTLTSEQYWSTSRIVAYVFKMLVHFGALVVIICFLLTNYFNTAETWLGDLTQHMIMTQMLPFSDKSFFRGAKVFNEVPEARCKE
ncbi:quinon protein alcohol dehydrogenase-like superfamily [Suillus bovinus]|uniref:quinon protein alcohol dehydrogenase-like superfamily n=1 Tax=Suillus bovinus TaxID=48563 RepID=UPI001B8776CE|nr:quinon protein alcohol dehydrogenase-like superfamily [Suillus bovinus]KAG2140902.1 quinon protein alcohol dehydrogenase-like superfamily [Suillus bovinus]